MTFDRIFSLSLALAVDTVGIAQADGAYVVDHRKSPHTSLRPLPIDAVRWTDGFWADRSPSVQLHSKRIYPCQPPPGTSPPGSDPLKIQFPTNKRFIS